MPDDRLRVVTRRAFLQAAAAAACAGRAGAAPASGAPMPVRMLGRTGQKVSLLGLGGAHIMTRLDGRDAETAAGQLDDSLKRLGTDHVDLLQFNEVIRDSDPDRIFAFERQVLPRLVQEGAGVIAMKALGDHAIIDTGLVTPLECWHYVMNLPMSVFVAGIDSPAVLESALQAARQFRPLDAGALSVVRAKTTDAARYGEQELYKTTTKFDGTERHPEWLGPSPA